MALCKLWTTEVASEPPLLTLAMDHSLRAFGHDHLSGPNDILPRPLASLLVSFLFFFFLKRPHVGT